MFGWDKKFVSPFISFIHEHFSDGKHNFIIYGDVASNALPASSDTKIYSSLLKNIITVSKALYHAEKIVLHGLFSNHLLYILALQPWLLKKCYWVIWGGDLYVHQSDEKDWRWKKNEVFRKFVIKNLGFIVTGNTGDYNLTKKWYESHGVKIDCFVYPNNIFQEHVVLPKKVDSINLLIGNSADRSNHHFDTFNKLIPFKDDNIQIYCPLSYGDMEYAKEVVEKGKILFGEKFHPIVDYISYEKYIKFLANIDIAIFNHKRQQAFGTKITLLGFGKKIYLSKHSTLWDYFKDNEIIVFNVEALDLTKIDVQKGNLNIKTIKRNLSREKLIECLKLWLYK